MPALKALNLALAFLLELALLAAFAYWGFNAGDSSLVRIVLGVGIPVLIAIIWGILLAPKSSRRLRGTAYLALKLVLFGLAVVALFAASQPTLALIFAVVVLVNTALAYVWKQE